MSRAAHIQFALSHKTNYQTKKLCHGEEKNREIRNESLITAKHKKNDEKYQILEEKKERKHIKGIYEHDVVYKGRGIEIFLVLHKNEKWEISIMQKMYISTIGIN